MKNAVKEKSEIKINPNDTWLNHGIKTLDDVKNWILCAMGHPLVTVELNDD